ncbi:MAG: hypothetical protein V1855_03160 [bacterium]
MVPKKMLIPILFVVVSGSPLMGKDIACKQRRGQEVKNQKTQRKIDKQLGKSQNKHTMVIFIHGTILPILSFTDMVCGFNSYMCKDRQDGRGEYQCFLNDLRFKNLYQYQPIASLGLHKISSKLCQNSGCWTSMVGAILYEKMCELLPDEASNSFSFYAFGWEGRLSARRRGLWADVLYRELVKKIREEKSKLKKNEALEVEILAHSHGGNVALNLAHSERKYKRNLVVDRLILLGTPVQSETEYCIYSSMFKNIFNVYSNGDKIQVIDIFSTQDSWSRRFFKTTSLFSNRMIQIEVRANKIKPLHNELWFFGGKKNWRYRKYFLLEPLPFFVFMPLVVNYFNHYVSGSHHVLLNLEKIGSSFTFSCAKKNTRPLDFKKSGFAVSLEDLMCDFSDGMLPDYVRLAFHFVGIGG